MSGGFSWTSENRRTVLLINNCGNVKLVGCTWGLFICLQESPAYLESHVTDWRWMHSSKFSFKTDFLQFREVFVLASKDGRGLAEGFSSCQHHNTKNLFTRKSEECRLLILILSILNYSGLPISRTLGFPNLPISRTKPCFPWICFTQAL